MTNPLQKAEPEMDVRIKAVGDRDRAARRRAGHDPIVRTRWVEPWSLKERT